MTTADVALQRLLDGNAQYAADRLAVDVSLSRRLEVSQNQKPFAMIFSCVDSRVPPELVFNQSLGSLLVIRTAGEVLDQAVLGSLEFGALELKIPLLVVLGHERCGAVKSAIDVLCYQAKAEGGIAYLVDALAPAVEQGKRAGGSLWDAASRAHIALQVERLKGFPVLAPAVESGDLKIVGAWYSLMTGLVEIIAR